MYYSTEISWQCVSGATDIQLFLYKVFRLKFDPALGITDTYHASRKADLIDRHHVSDRTAYRLNYHIGSQSAGIFLHTFMHILRA